MALVIDSEEIEIKSCMQLKGGLFPLTTLQLLSNDLQALEEQLIAKMQQAPNFFNNAPIVIDLYHLTKNAPNSELPQNVDVSLDFFALKDILITKNLIPVGVKNATQEQQQQAIDANLAILRSNNNFENYSKQPNTKATTVHQNETLNTHVEASSKSLLKNKLVTDPVRSGQQIYAPDGDITVVGSVSHGSELLADGNIHVYGALRGRALAGINNNTLARIFCSSLEADLISIAGQFKISENIDLQFWKKPVQIQLLNGKIEITEI